MKELALFEDIISQPTREGAEALLKNYQKSFDMDTTYSLNSLVRKHFNLRDRVNELLKKVNLLEIRLLGK